MGDLFLLNISDLANSLQPSTNPKRLLRGNPCGAGRPLHPGSLSCNDHGRQPRHGQPSSPLRRAKHGIASAARACRVERKASRVKGYKWLMKKFRHGKSSTQEKEKNIRTPPLSRKGTTAATCLMSHVRGHTPRSLPNPCSQPL